MRSDRAITGAMLQAGALPSRGRDPNGHTPVVVAPIGPVPGQRPRLEPLVCIDRRSQESSHANVVVQHPGSHQTRRLAETVLGFVVVEDVVAALVAEREIDVEAVSLASVDRLSHEREQHASLGGNLLGHDLEQECVVGCAERVGVGKGQLCLAVGVLTVHRFEW